MALPLETGQCHVKFDRSIRRAGHSVIFWLESKSYDIWTILYRGYAILSITSDKTIPRLSFRSLPPLSGIIIIVSLSRLK